MRKRPLMRELTRSEYYAAVAFCLLVGSALRYPAFDAAPLADDYDHFAMTHDRYPVERGALDLYTFVGRGERTALMQDGRLPWWSDPSLRLAVFRPLSSLMVAIDGGPLGSDMLAMRVHSLLWWSLAVLAVAGLMRSLLPQPVALVAVLLYAVEEAHTYPLAWIANRHSLVAAAFGAAAIWRHTSARRQGAVRAPALAVVLAALCLLAGEYGFALLAYVLAFEIAGKDGAPRERVFALLPYAALGVLYLAARSAFGFGVQGSGFYVSPIRAPLAYAEGALTRIPAMLADLGWAIPSELSFMGFRPLGEAWPTVHVVAGLAVLALVAAGSWYARGLISREVRWLALGSLLSLVPVCATIATTRLLVAGAIGMSAVVATLLVAAACALRDATGWRWRVGAAVVLLALLAMHVAMPGVRAVSESRYLYHRSHSELSMVLEAQLPIENIEQTRVLVVAAHDWLSSCAIPYALVREGRAAPRSHHLMSGAAWSRHVLKRVSSDTMDLVVLDDVPGAFLGSVYRSADAPFSVGDRIELEAFAVEVLETRHGQPTRMRFRFAHSLDEPGYWFLFPTSRGMMQVAMPAIGTEVKLPRSTASILVKTTE